MKTILDDGNSFKTRDGRRVINLQLKPHNSQGQLVTFPIKGTIIECEKPLRTSYQIWTADGQALLFNSTNDDLFVCKGV